MKETELWQRLESTLGPGYYRVWATEFSLAELANRTVARGAGRRRTQQGHLAGGVGGPGAAAPGPLTGLFVRDASSGPAPTGRVPG